MATANETWEKKLQDSSAIPISLPLEFLKSITCYFSVEQELGRGGYGVVYKGTLPSGAIIAVKNLFDLHRVGDERFQKEVSSLMGIKHQNIVQFLGYCAESSFEAVDLEGSGNYVLAELPKRLLCFEHVCNKSLDKYISDKSSCLEWNMRYEIIRGICGGLHYLHNECHLVHLDLKPENILMDDTMVPKIADFGLSRIFGDKQSRIITRNCQGTRGYMAPEYIIQGLVSIKADIFSLGVIIIEILTGHRGYPFHDDNNPEGTATSFQHFKDNILELWRNSLQKSQGDTVLLEQVRVCAELGIQCVAFYPDNRPVTKHMIDRLDDVSIIDRSVKTGVSSTSTVAQICRHRVNLMDLYGFGAAEIKSEIKVHLHSTPNKGESSTARVARPDEANRHRVLERMLCDENVEPACLELSLLEDITNNFSSDHEIARSPSGVFYKGVLSNGSTVVVKRLAIAFAIDDKQFLQAVKSLMSVKHINIVRFLGYCAIAQGKEAKEGGKTVMVVVRERLLCFEYLHNGNLQMHITDESHGFDWHARYQTIKGICEGLYYLHNKFISLLDLKADNILFDERMMPKILNYGFSRFFNEVIRLTVLKNKTDGSLAYMATPECLAGGLITFKSDMYSLGLIIMQIVTGQNKKNYSDIATIVESWRSRLELDASNGGHAFETSYQQVKVCIEIGIRCMDNDPGNRPIPRYIIDRLHKMEAACSVGSSSAPQETSLLQSEGVKMVLKVPVIGKNCKRSIMQIVSKIEGLNSLAFDSDKSMLTVVGNVDVVDVLTALGEKYPAEVITVGEAGDQAAVICGYSYSKDDCTSRGPKHTQRADPFKTPFLSVSVRMGHVHARLSDLVRSETQWGDPFFRTSSPPPTLPSPAAAAMPPVRSLERTMRTLDRQISQFVTMDRLIWADSADADVFLETVDDLIDTVQELDAAGTNRGLLDRADELLSRCMARLEDEFRALIERPDDAAPAAPGGFDSEQSEDEDGLQASGHERAQRRAGVVEEVEGVGHGGGEAEVAAVACLARGAGVGAAFGADDGVSWCALVRSRLRERTRRRRRAAELGAGVGAMVTGRGRDEGERRRSGGRWCFGPLTVGQAGRGEGHFFSPRGQPREQTVPRFGSQMDRSGTRGRYTSPRWVAFFYPPCPSGPFRT